MVRFIEALDLVRATPLQHQPDSLLAARHQGPGVPAQHINHLLASSPYGPCDVSKPPSLMSLTGTRSFDRRDGPWALTKRLLDSPLTEHELLHPIT